ncbi:MAG: hypothetical protein IPJ65_12410 [Archangiaceae bacterium]|nr:hypothetical protein [Archangiaceae bacterium]
MRSTILLLAAAGALALAGVTSSCSSGTGGGTAGGSGGSGGGTAGGSGGAGGSAGGSAGGTAGGVEMADADAGICDTTFLANCATYVDRTAADAGRTIEFGTDDPTAAVPQCMQVKKGQSVTFHAGAFHPVLQDCGPKNGKLVAPDDATTTIQLNVAGDYGYHCSIHQFKGIVKVVP